MPTLEGLSELQGVSFAGRRLSSKGTLMPREKRRYRSSGVVDDAAIQLAPSEAIFYLRGYAVKYNLVSMTRLSKSKLSASKAGKDRPPKGRVGHWVLQDAKARFSELVRKVRSEGPQHVTVHGRDEVVVIAAEEFRRLQGNVTGKALIEAMQASPHRDTEIESKRGTMPVRDVSL